MNRDEAAEFLELMRYAVKALDRIVHAQERLVEVEEVRREVWERMVKIDEELRRRDQMGL